MLVGYKKVKLHTSVGVYYYISVKIYVVNLYYDRIKIYLSVSKFQDFSSSLDECPFKTMGSDT